MTKSNVKALNMYGQAIRYSKLATSQTEEHM